MLRHPATGAVAVKLIYFGGRFISVFVVAHLLGSEASIYLFAVALSEVMRLIFDFGLESHVIARLHGKSHAALHRYRHREELATWRSRPCAGVGWRLCKVVLAGSG